MSNSIAVYQALTTASSYFWNTNDTTPSISVGPYPIGSQLVFSVDTDTNGCTNNDFTTLHVQQCSLLEIIMRKTEMFIYPNLVLESFILSYSTLVLILNKFKS